MIFEALNCLFSGIGVGIFAIIKAIPIYFELDSIKEQLIVYAFNVPVFIVSLVLSMPLVIKIIIFVVKP